MNIIKIDDNLFTQKKNTIKKISNENLYCIDIELLEYLQLLEYPIKKELALENILKFIQYFTSKMEDCCININSKELRNIFGGNYKDYLFILKEKGVITDIPNESGKFYEKGKYSKKYTFFSKWRNSNDLCFVIFDKKIKMIKYIDDNIKELNLDKRMINTVMNKLSINYELALKDEIQYYIDNNNNDINGLRKRINRLLDTKQKRYIKKGNNVNRIYHSFFNISKISRKHLNIKMNMIDLKSSQPIILISYLKNNNYMFDNNYQTDCENGIFYQSFYEVDPNDYNIDPEVHKNNVKVGLYKGIFFNFNEKSLYNKKFKELYPRTYTSIKYINELGENLAIILQNREAELFNNLKLKDSKYFFTLFDAVYFNEKTDLIYLLDQINDFFKKDGISPITEQKLI
jgi:hypothetical protein